MMTNVTISRSNKRGSPSAQYKNTNNCQNIHLAPKRWFSITHRYHGMTQDQQMNLLNLCMSVFFQKQNVFSQTYRTKTPIPQMPCTPPLLSNYRKNTAVCFVPGRCSNETNKTRIQPQRIPCRQKTTTSLELMKQMSPERPLRWRRETTGVDKLTRKSMVAREWTTARAALWTPCNRRQFRLRVK